MPIALNKTKPWYRSSLPPYKAVQSLGSWGIDHKVYTSELRSLLQKPVLTEIPW